MKKLDCAKYIKKPVVLEAIKFEYDNEVIQWIKKKFKGVEIDFIWESWMVKTIEGWIKMKDWDYIIKGVDGEFYPCKASIFNKTYQKVE
jgi:hypothetical protein